MILSNDSEIRQSCDPSASAANTDRVTSFSRSYMSDITVFPSQSSSVGDAEDMTKEWP